jgi:molybdopterin-biosynthesis enzyme MoeA-like protein
MPNFFQAGSGVITNVIVGDSKEDLETVFGGTWIEIEPEVSVGIGWTYDEATKTFSAPVIEEPVIEEEGATNA